MKGKFISRKEFLKHTAWAGGGLWLGLDVLAKSIPGSFDRIFPDDDVLYFKQGDGQYDELRHGFNKRIDKLPFVIALCKNTNGVVAAVNYARINNLPVAIKSGGHCMEGLSCSNGGMVINLSLLNKFSWKDPDHITAGPALRLIDLYKNCLPKGKIVPGGSCQSVALGGLTLGGGYGLLSRQFGLTCDSLTKITMVDGLGNIISSADDSELLWACKGGANGNFGIITEMDFRVHKAPLSMQSYRLRYRSIPEEKIIPLMETWFTVAPALPKHCFSALIINNKSAYILLTSTKKSTADIQSPLNALKAVTTSIQYSRPKALAVALKSFYAESQPVFFKNASAGLYKNFDDIKGCMNEVITVLKSTPGMIYQVNTLGGEVQNPFFGQSSSFPYRDYNFFSELQAYYNLPAQAPELLLNFESIQHIFEKNGVTAHYRNYPDINFKTPLQQYYGVNLERLRLIKNKYDPENNIRHEQSII
jgi:hypothetical protein